MYVYVASDMFIQLWS